MRGPRRCVKGSCGTPRTKDGFIAALVGAQRQWLDVKRRVAPRPAATVVIARGEEAWEALFLKRHHKSGFMANAYVFPGGRVDASDASVGNLSRIQGLDLEKLCSQMEGVSTAVEAASYVIAVVRETFEEAGILLARDQDGAWVDFTEGPTAERFADWRNRLNGGETSFERLLVDEDLCIAGEGLHYFDHWVTPAQEPRRYDARFFVVSAPPRQRGRHDGHETTESVWHTPRAALDGAPTTGGNPYHRAWNDCGPAGHIAD